MKNRLFTQGLLTTTIGLIVLGVAAYFIHKDMDNGASLSEASTAAAGWITLGGTLLWAKSSLLKSVFKKDTTTDATQRDNGVTPH